MILTDVNTAYGVSCLIYRFVIFEIIYEPINLIAVGTYERGFEISGGRKIFVVYFLFSVLINKNLRI